jgi:hypothetical protein
VEVPVVEEVAGQAEEEQVGDDAGKLLAVIGIALGGSAPGPTVNVIPLPQVTSHALEAVDESYFAALF